MPSNIEALAAKVEALRAEIAELDALETPTDEQNARFDAALTEIDTAKADYDAAVERAERVARAAALSIDPANVERAQFHAPNVVVKRDTFDDLAAVERGNVSPSEMVSR